MNFRVRHGGFIYKRKQSYRLLRRIQVLIKCLTYIWKASSLSSFLFKLIVTAIINIIFSHILKLFKVVYNQLKDNERLLKKIVIWTMWTFLRALYRFSQRSLVLSIHFTNEAYIIKAQRTLFSIFLYYQIN